MSRELRNKDELRQLLDSALELTGVKVGHQEEFERRWAAVLACVAVDAPPRESKRVPENIAGMAVVLDPTVPLGVAQIRDANGKLCAELDLLYGGYTLYRRPDA